MLRGLFDFRGRLARLPYLGFSVLNAAGALALGLLVVAAGAAARTYAGASEQAVQNGGVTAFGFVLLVAAWVWLATAAKRMRDMGLTPWIALPVWLVLWVLAGALLRGAGFSNATFLMFAVFFLPLFVWPSRSRAEDAQAAAFA